MKKERKIEILCVVRKMLENAGDERTFGLCSMFKGLAWDREISLNEMRYFLEEINKIYKGRKYVYGRFNRFNVADGKLRAPVQDYYWLWNPWDKDIRLKWIDKQIKKYSNGK